MVSGRSFPDPMSRTCHVCQSEPEFCVAYTSSFASQLGDSPLIVVEPSAESVLGSMSTRGGSVQPGGRVKHGLVLQTGVVEVEVLVAHVERRAVALVVDDRLQVRSDDRPLRDRVQILAGQRSLGFDPRPGGRRVDRLERAKRVGHLRSIVVVDGTVSRCGRIDRTRSRRRRGVIRGGGLGQRCEWGSKARDENGAR